MDGKDLPEATDHPACIASLDEARARRIAKMAWRTQLCYGPVAAQLVLMTEDNPRAWALYRALQRGARQR